jgi:chemotaxis protein CheD
MVRIGELAASATPGDVLVALGLGSCIGLALVDTRRGIAGLAHVMLPDSGASAAREQGKFADRAVPALLDLVLGLGALRSGLEAVLVGGARMFDFGKTSALDVGNRNEIATRAALEQSRIPVRAAATSGSRGRTVRVHVDGPRVVVKEAGGTPQHLFGVES